MLTSAASADPPCGKFQPVGDTTVTAGQQNGGYDVTAGDATFTATMDWGDGSQSSVSVDPTNNPKATLTRAVVGSRETGLSSPSRGLT